MVAREIVATVGEWLDKDRGCLGLIDLLEDCTEDRNSTCSTYARDEADRAFENSAVSWDVNLRLDSGLSNGNYSGSEVNQTDVAGDCIARQAPLGLGRVCILLKFRSLRAYRWSILHPSIALLSIVV